MTTNYYLLKRQNVYVHIISLSNRIFHQLNLVFYIYFLEKEMATYSSVLIWRIPWTEEPGRLQSMRSQESDTI